MSPKSFAAHVSRDKIAKNALEQLDKLFGFNEDGTRAWALTMPQRTNIYETRGLLLALKTSLELVAEGVEKTVPTEAVNWMHAIEKDASARTVLKEAERNQDYTSWREELLEITARLTKSRLIKGLGGKSSFMSHD